MTTGQPCPRLGRDRNRSKPADRFATHPKLPTLERRRDEIERDSSESIDHRARYQLVRPGRSISSPHRACKRRDDEQGQNGSKAMVSKRSESNRPPRRVAPRFDAECARPCLGGVHAKFLPECDETGWICRSWLRTKARFEFVLSRRPKRRTIVPRRSRGG